MAPEGYPFGRLFCVSLPNRLDFLSFALLFPYFVVNLWQFRRHSGGVRKDFTEKVLLRLSS